MDILAALTNRPPERAAEGVGDYAGLKRALTDAVVATLEPIQDRYRALAGVRAEAATRAAERAGATLSRARRAMRLR